LAVFFFDEYIVSDEDLQELTVPQTPIKPTTITIAISIRRAFFIISSFIVINYLLVKYSFFSQKCMPPHKKQNNEKFSGHTNFFCSALFPTVISTAFQAPFRGAKTKQFLRESFLHFCTKNTKKFNICK